MSTFHLASDVMMWCSFTVMFITFWISTNKWMAAVQELREANARLYQTNESVMGEVDRMNETLALRDDYINELRQEIDDWRQGASVEASEADRLRDQVKLLEEDVPEDYANLVREIVAVRHQNQNYAEALRTYSARNRELERLADRGTWDEPEVDRPLTDGTPMSRTDLLLRD